MKFVENFCRACDNALVACNSIGSDKYTLCLQLGGYFYENEDEFRTALTEYILPNDAKKINDYITQYLDHAVEVVCETNNFDDAEQQAMKAFAGIAQAMLQINVPFADYIFTHCTANIPITAYIDEYVWVMKNICWTLDRLMSIYSPAYGTHIEEEVDEQAIAQKKEELLNMLHSLENYQSCSLQIYKTVAEEDVTIIENLWHILSKSLQGNPFYMVVSDFYPLHLDKPLSYVLCGKVLGGKVSHGNNIYINGWAPYTVIGIEKDGNMVDEALVGDFIGLIIEPRWEWNKGIELSKEGNYTLCNVDEQNLHVDWQKLIADLKADSGFTFSKKELTRGYGNACDIIYNIVDATCARIKRNE